MQQRNKINAIDAHTHIDSIHVHMHIFIYVHVCMQTK